MDFCSRVLRLSEPPRCRERPQTAIFCLEWLGRLKFLATGQDESFSFHSTSRRCSRHRSPMCDLFSISVSYAVDDTGGGAREVVSDLNRSLGSKHFLYVMNERTSFAHWASALESSRFVIGLNWTFVQKVACVFVTFELNWWRLQKDSTSLWIVLKYFKVFENDVFNCVVVRVKCESEWKAIGISPLSRL